MSQFHANFNLNIHHTKVDFPRKLKELLWRAYFTLRGCVKLAPSVSNTQPRWEKFSLLSKINERRLSYSQNWGSELIEMEVLACQRFPAQSHDPSVSLSVVCWMTWHESCPNIVPRCENARCDEQHLVRKLLLWTEGWMWWDDHHDVHICERHPLEFREPFGRRDKIRLSMQFRNLASGGREKRGEIQRYRSDSTTTTKTAKSGTFQALADGLG